AGRPEVLQVPEVTAGQATLARTLCAAGGGFTTYSAPEGSVDHADAPGVGVRLEAVTEERLVAAASAAMSSDLDPTPALESFAQVLRDFIPFVHMSLTVINDDKVRGLIALGLRPPRDDGRVVMPLAATPAAQV